MKYPKMVMQNSQSLIANSSKKILEKESKEQIQLFLEKMNFALSDIESQLSDFKESKLGRIALDNATEDLDNCNDDSSTLMEVKEILNFLK